MALHGYSRVTEQGFMAFDAEVNKGAWGEILLPVTLMADGVLTVSPMDLTVERYFKLRVSTSLVELAVVLSGDDPVTIADRRWDATERKFSNQNKVHLDDDNPEIRAAAKRVQEQLTLGEGTEQTKLSHEKQIDFGRSQVFQASQEPLKSDIQKLGLQGLLAEISTRTEALAHARGRDTQDEAPRPLSLRLRAAKAKCVDAFNAVHDHLDWMIERTPKGIERDRLIAMRVPFIKLLERYPSTGEQAAAEELSPPPASDQ